MEDIGDIIINIFMFFQFKIMRYYVYKLVDPRTNNPFYIGKGCGNRMYSHLREATLPREKQVNSFKCSVINNILSCGKNIIIEKVKDGLNEENAYQLEQELIVKYGKRIDGTGYLTNLVDGGLGGTGQGKHIECYSITGAFVRAYKSLTEAADHLGINKSTICAALNGRTKLAGNYRWAYTGDILSPYVNNHCSPVSKFSLDGSLICSYTGVKEAARDVKVTYTSIVDCISGSHHTAGGFRWAYLGELPNNIPENYVVSSERRFACYNDDMELVAVYENLKDAVDVTGAVSSGIVDRCAGRVKYKTGGFYWKYY